MYIPQASFGYSITFWEMDNVCTAKRTLKRNGVC